MDIPSGEITLLNRLENAILERLNVLVDMGARVEAQPANEESGRPVPKGLLTVAYVRSRWSRPKDRRDPVQDEELQFQISWRLRDLRSHQETYKLTRATKWLLTGWVPDECLDAGFYPLDAELVEQDEQGYWRFYMMFGLLIRSV
ncbi:hypothetical protein GS597_01445 [Synechococcales cyanobacterium C]|uniref:Uncharacterized protein n=1 Tax=Petrachloros mirabilis ULC683 TaxID=2781853 RepID=A0A8K2ABU6_9CYAN|nr:hypothetical protein [Petrachloros mirabilis ULC683]